ncbi:tRNA pseudouridine synthase D [Ancylostoma ceylanicum]|nr:tRNA pseudouridine synthase D [Ancylostoma ceylanicum]
MEVDYGITNYLGDRKVSVPCVLKELYSDFIVQEISADETVLRIATASEMRNFVKNEEEKGVDESAAVPSVISAEQVSALDGLNKDSKPLLIPTEGLSKDERKAIHEFLRLRYQGKLGSETSEKGIEVSYCGVNSKTRKRKRWAKDCPNHCYFTLAKENKDTSYALGLIAKFLNVTVNTFRTHGIKDRRAVTCQRVSCNRIEKERILSLNPRLRDIVVYDFSYQDQELKMGGHWGNRFSIILRSIPPETRDILEERLKEFEKDGFINYFGTQRFGSCDTNTAVVGKHILRRDWEGAVRLILSNEHLPGYLGTVGNAVRCWEKTRDASQALKQLKGSQAFASIEAIIFRCLAKGGTWQQCITEALPINLRSLYVHAYQSLLWNKVASRRVAEKGTTVCPDDLGKDGQKLADGASIFDVYIPLPGENTNYERNYVSEWYEEMMKEDGLTNSSFSSLEDRFALGETTRAMLICPKDVKWKFINYSEPRAYLQDGINTRAIDESEMVGDLLALQVQFSLPSGSYATVALRQITGTDMGKRSMKIHAESARNGGNGVEGDDAEAVDESECPLVVDGRVLEESLENPQTKGESEDVSQEAGESSSKIPRKE